MFNNDRIMTLTPWQRICLCFAAFCGLSGVALAALTAHLPERFFIAGGRPMTERAIDMQMWHAVLLCALALYGAPRFRWIAASFAIGLMLFCIPVYALALRGPNFAIVAPTGGTLVMLSWLALMIAALRR